MLITVHLTPPAAAAMRGKWSTVESNLRETLDELGVQLEPLHPGVSDPDLAGQFFASVDDASAEAVCIRLRGHAAVEAAYTKPAGSPPDGGQP
jgi:hypothetical protein